MRLRSGTSGFSYRAWKGTFYPADLTSEAMLRFYGERLGAVEVDSTFYRIPKASTLVAWSGQVPADFRFALKAPQRVTHEQRLQGSAESLAYFYRVAAELGAKLGAVLFQLPPFLKKDLPRLMAFLELLPAGGRAAFEFRHRSWLEDNVFEALRKHNAALCAAEAEEIEVPLVPTATWGYLRLRRPHYSGGELQAWAERILEQPWDETFVFFKHEDGATGPQLALALSSLVEAKP
ncbi:MAG TPA: DUF72 domain-containing protein [Anaeromyxobacteraceae bacterium]|nr:DUF72 domain-containing protein [Anaeromyxobacteraceae bacterium]